MPATQKAGKRRYRKRTAKKGRRSMKRSNKRRGGSTAKKTVGGKKRKPSAYNMHIKKEMKKGKTMKQAAASWRAPPSPHRPRRCGSGRAA